MSTGDANDRRGRCRGVRRALLALCVASATPAAAQGRLETTSAQWTVADDFAKNSDARSNLSGAACATRAPPFRVCLIVNDEKKYAQFFAIDGTLIRPGQVIRLVAEGAPGNPDAEGAAYDNGYFYVTGSHGRSRNHPGQDSTPSYVVFRIPVDPRNGEPDFGVSADEVVGVEASQRLRLAIRRGDRIGDFYEKKLKNNGVNIEGIAVKDGRMYLGLRGPSDDGYGFILSVDADAVFSADAPLKARVDRLKLGASSGIRDLAAVGAGLLVLSGPVNDQQVTPAVHLWIPQRGELRRLGQLSIPPRLAEAKAETLLVLNDTDGEPWRALVMFDGPDNGAPTEYLIPR